MIEFAHGWRFFVGVALFSLTAVHRSAAQADRGSLAALVSAVSYGVPASPAFELLPGQPSDVVHVVTPADFRAHLASWVVGGALQNGVGFDLRPFVGTVGSLRDYQTHPRRQILWRTVASMGTAPLAKGSSDMLVSGGFRIPLIDRGDPRADTDFISDLEAAYRRGLGSLQPEIPESTPDPALKARFAAASESADVQRKKFTDQHWNARKLDFGIAGALRAAGGHLDPQNLSGNRAGIWLAFVQPLGNSLEWTTSGKQIWVRPDSTSSETSRSAVGTRLRLFRADRFGISGEAAFLWSRYSHNTAKNDQWSHMAVLAEIPGASLLGWLKGSWIGVGYGGDVGHKGGSDNSLSFQYSVYTNRILKDK
ncbi:MAG: hypothetical protein JWM27_3170 [Gemmatimonadetes bacterium]|nr:hypothetical protein [Gemmatimonadota bacterium]